MYLALREQNQGLNLETTEEKVYGPTVPLSQEIHAMKYRSPGETFRESCNRRAGAMSDDKDHYYSFRDIIRNQRFLEAGRVQAAMGSTKVVTAHNCFVSGTIADSFVVGEGNIMQRATEAATTMRMGGGIGYDFSTLRPRGAIIKKLDSQSSGPVSFMDIFDSVCRCIACSGHRRGAQMGVLRVDHPDIEEFLHAKQNHSRLNGFNISIAITDEFMRAVKDRKPFTLKWNGEEYGQIDAFNLWENIMRSTWDWAEPGVLFIDRINDLNNLYYCETIAATNPCGEQPLPPYGACLLGSFNLVRYLQKLPQTGYFFDFNQLKTDIPHVVRAMDNVIDRATYPLEEQRQEAVSKRRMGLGITGLANTLEAMGYPYGSDGFIRAQTRIMELIRDETYKASAMLAKEKGAFPLYERQAYALGAFIETLPSHIQDLISNHGIRNSHLLSIAPCGTISLASDNVSSSIEPVFSYSFDRTIQTFEGPRTETVYDYGYKFLGVSGKRTQDVTPAEHLAVLKTAQKYVDSAVSKTCNVPPETPWEDFKDIYMQAWEAGCKGCTTFNSGGKRAGVLVADEDEKEVDEPAAACYIDPQTGKRECE